MPSKTKTTKTTKTTNTAKAKAVEPGETNDENVNASAPAGEVNPDVEPGTSDEPDIDVTDDGAPTIEPEDVKRAASTYTHEFVIPGTKLKLPVDFNDDDYKVATVRFAIAHGWRPTGEASLGTIRRHGAYNIVLPYTVEVDAAGEIGAMTSPSDEDGAEPVDETVDDDK